MPRSSRIVIGFIAAVLTTATLASAFSTQVVIAGLADIGVDVPFATRIGMTFSDLPILAVLVPAAAACLLPAFVIASLLSRLGRLPRLTWFVLAGGSAYLVELHIIEWQLGLMPIGGARTAAGMTLQTLAGAAGGWVYARFTAVDGEAP